MPYTSSIAGLFARSPFKPTQEHMQVVEECAEQLVPLFEALRDSDREKLLASRQRILELEHQADKLKNEIRGHLPKGLFMPVDRRDLLDLLHAQDSIADTAQEIARLVTLPKMHIPGPVKELVMACVRSNVEAARECGKIIGQLDELLEVGFQGREVQRVEEMVERLGAIESDTDEKELELLRTLMENEDQMSPASFFLWYQLFRKLGDIADYSEDVGDRLRLLIAR
ncbi:MAG: TIGR00153 family protein [Acidobacteriota bacterium]